MPDEHVNNSEAGGVSLKASSCQDTSVTVVVGRGQEAEPDTGRWTGRVLDSGRGPGEYVTITDLDGKDLHEGEASFSSDDTRYAPDTPRNPPLTAQLLTGHAQTDMSRDDRIFQWLAECDKETVTQSLPTHLPDIQYTFKFLKSGAT